MTEQTEVPPEISLENSLENSLIWNPLKWKILIKPIKITFLH